MHVLNLASDPDKLFSKCPNALILRMLHVFVFDIYISIVKDLFKVLLIFMLNSDVMDLK